MFNSPGMQHMMENMLGNEQMRNFLFNSNPDLKDMIDNNPEVRETFNNPEMLRQSLALLSNPAYAQQAAQQFNRMRND